MLFIGMLKITMVPFLLGGKDNGTMCSDRTGREREGSGGAETAGCTPQIFLGTYTQI